MRKYILALSLVVILASSGVAYSYDDPQFQGWRNKSAEAQQRNQGTPVRVLKLVRNSANGPNVASIASADVVVYDTVSDDGVTIRHTTTSADGAFAGVAVTAIPTSDASGTGSVNGINAQADNGRRNWGWIVVHGPVPANVTGNNGANVGDILITSGDAGVGTTIQNRGGVQAITTNGISALGGNGGFFLDTPGAATVAEVFVKAE